MSKNLNQSQASLSAAEILLHKIVLNDPFRLKNFQLIKLHKIGHNTKYLTKNFFHIVHFSLTQITQEKLIHSNYSNLITDSKNLLQLS